jgi:hypothetical protein
MENPETLDQLFQEAVSVIDAGEVEKLEDLLMSNPVLVSKRLECPGTWLIDKAGSALDGYFKQPYLLWFVAECVTRDKRVDTCFVIV